MIDVKINVRPKNYTSVWLKRDDFEPHIFYCHNCTTAVLKYKGTVATMVPGVLDYTDNVMQFPLEVYCKGRNPLYGKCPMIYVFEGLAE